MKGAVSIPLLIAAVGLVSFLFISSTFSFQNKVFQSLFFKPRSFASELSSIPTVDLKINFKGQTLDGAINLSVKDSLPTLSWTTTGNPTSCVGSSWGIIDQDKTWDGSKESKGGNFVVKNINKANPYIYVINCTNDKGDAIGDSVSINIGAEKNTLAPTITLLKTYQQNKELVDPILVGKGSDITLKWSSLNTATPYSICVSIGSWPIFYKNIANLVVEEILKVTTSKIHSLSVYCSNEGGSAQSSLAIFVE